MENAPAIPPATTDAPYQPARRRRHQPIVGPVVLISLGLVFLGQNVGMLPADTWVNLWQFWPVLLILAGLEIILGGSSWGSVLAVLLSMVAIAGLVATVALFGQFGTWGSAERPFGAIGPVATDHLSQEVGDARRAIVDLEHGGGRLEITALSGESSQLVEADLSYSQQSTVNRQIEPRGDGTYVRLQARNDFNGFPIGNSFRQNWDVRLSPNVPVELRVKSGASAVAMDLANLKVTSLNVDSGASGVDITMPQAAGRTEARIKAGAAGVHIRIPEGVAARIRTENGLSAASVDQVRFPKNGNYYQSPNFDTAANRVEIRMETGVSGVTID